MLCRERKKEGKAYFPPNDWFVEIFAKKYGYFSTKIGVGGKKLSKSVSGYFRVPLSSRRGEEALMARPLEKKHFFCGFSFVIQLAK